MPEYLSPGVYVEEYDSGAVPMAGVSTSTAGFVGVAQRGPIIGRPQFITSFADYQRIYGGYLGEAKYGEMRFLPYAVEQFFINGGARAYIMRVAPDDAKAASAQAGCVRFEAANPGEWANRIRITALPAAKGKSLVASVAGSEATLKNPDGFGVGDPVEMYDGRTKSYAKIINIMENTLVLDSAAPAALADTTIGTAKYIKTCELSVSVKCDDVTEDYPVISLNPESPYFIGAKLSRSELVRASVVAEKAVVPVPAAEGKEKPAAPASKPAHTPFEQLGGSADSIVIALEGGADGSKVTADKFIGSDGGPGLRTGIQAFKETPDISIAAAPGIVMPAVQAALIAMCENTKSCFAVLDAPIEAKKPAEVLDHRNLFDSTYAAMYHPWLEMMDPLAKKSAYMPPSGAMCGVYARVDTDRGVHKAPANEVVRGCTGLSCRYNEGEQDILNPAGVNLIRAFAGRGIRVWGARTISSNGLWKYINVRRLFIYVEESIRASTNWVVFEPNSEVLWGRVGRTIEMFLSTLWRDGALAGMTPAEAFFVEIGRTTMSQDDIDNGRLICQIGIAPVKPAEFVIFRLTQHTAVQ